MKFKFLFSLSSLLVLAATLLVEREVSVEESPDSEQVEMAVITPVAISSVCVAPDCSTAEIGLTGLTGLPCPCVPGLTDDIQVTISFPLIGGGSVNLAETVSIDCETTVTYTLTLPPNVDCSGDLQLIDVTQDPDNSDGAGTCPQSVPISNLFVSMGINPSAETNGPYGPFCVDDPNIVLRGSPSPEAFQTGFWTGPGVIDVSVLDSVAQFDPELAGPGIHMIEYQFTDETGCMGMDTVMIEVFESPLANAGDDTTFCANDVMQISAAVSGGVLPYTINWTAVNGGFSDASALSPDYIPGIAGTDELVLTIVDANGCTTTDTLLVEVLEAPALDPGSDTSVCTNDALVLAANATGGVGPYVYSWVATGGAFDNPASATPTYTHTVPGAYNITLFVFDQNGCQTDSTIEVIVREAATIDLGGNQILCSNSALNFAPTISGGLMPYTFVWTASGGSFDDSTASNPVYTNTTPGAYNVTLEVQESGSCITRETIVVTVLDSVELTMSDRFLVCEQSSTQLQVDVAGGTPPYTYLWSNTGGSFVDIAVEDPVFQSTTPGLNLVTLTVTDAFGCTAVQSAIVEVGSGFTLDLGGDVNMCDNSPLTLNPVITGGNPSFSYVWSSNGGSFDDASSATPNYSNSVPGNYQLSLSVTDSFGCSQMETINVTVNEGPVVDAGLDRTICNDEPIVLSPTVVAPNSPVSYLWTADGGGFSDATVPNPNFSSLVPGVYTLVLTVTDAFGCQGVDSLEVLVNQEPFFQSCPDTLFFGTDQGQCSAFANWQAPVGLDHCNLNVSVSQTFGPPSGSNLLTDTVYRIEYTVVADNGTGNSSTCEFFVVIRDTECPSIVASLPADMTLACTETPEPFEVIPEWHTADNCTDPSDIMVTYEEDTTDITCENSYVIKRYWTVSDLADNACTYTQKITINDTIAPTFDIAGDTSLTCTELSTLPTLVTNISDNCTPDSLLDVSFVDSTDQQGSSDSCAFYNYTIWRHYTVSDACGNGVSQVQRIDIEDNELPTAVCRTDTVYLDENGMATITVEDINAGSFDNCAPDSVLQYRLSRDTFGCADVGLSDVVLYVQDPCGNEGGCVANVLVMDTLAPAVTCPIDQIITLGPGECGEVFNFAPSIDDNCSSSWTSTPESGTELEIGTHTIVVTVADSGANTATCSFEVEIREFPNPITSMACNNQINISLDENCEASINPDYILEGGPYGCYDDFVLVVTDPATGDTVHGPPHFGIDDINQTFQVTVINPETGLSCWGNVLVEQKVLPGFECPPDTIIPCNHPTDYGVMGSPIVTSCEPSFEIDFVDQVTDFGACGTPRREIKRTWTVVDESNNEVSCQQTIEIASFDLSEIEFPEDRSRPNGNAISCSDVAADSSITNPEFTGRPTIQGIVLDPMEQTLCDFTLSYWDKIQPGCGNSYTILREWKLSDVCEPVNDGINPLVHTQLIHVIDDEPPAVESPLDITLSAGNVNCLSSWSIPDPVVQDCSPFIYTVSSSNGDILDLNPGYVLTNLDIDGATVTYVIEDFCGNIVTHDIDIEIVDDIKPTPVCDEFTVVNLTSDGFAKVEALTFDDGSHDNCGPVYIKAIKKKDLCGTSNGAQTSSTACTSCDGINGDDDVTLPGSQVYFDDYVIFCCDEVGEDVSVIMRVFDVDPGEGPVTPSRMDEGGDLYHRFNDCEINASVEDKIPPFLTCPPNITLSCEFNYDTESIQDLMDRTFGTMVTENADRQDVVVPGHGNPVYTDNFVWGQDGLANDNCDVLIEITLTEEISCGEGEVARTFTATDPSGNTNSCTQRVIFESFDPFGNNDIIWPEDVTVNNVCLDEVLADESFGGRPQYGAHVCSDVFMSREDEIFINDPDGCAKILRHWTLLDWCQYDDETGEGEFEYTQVIIVGNSLAPTIQDCETVTVCDTLAEDCTTFVDLTIDASDDCTADENLLYSYAIDFFHEDDGDPNNFNSDLSSNGQSAEAEGGNDASGNIPFGVHLMRWWVEDGCGNVAFCEKILDIRDCKAPSPKCQSGIVTVVMESVGSVEIWASDFDAGSEDNCGDVEFSFSSDVTDINRTFTCDDLGNVTVEIWVTDAFGNQAFCETFLFVQDNSNTCDNSSLGNIGGHALTPGGDGVDEVEVSLYTEVGDVLQQVMTATSGTYSFEDVAHGQNYSIEMFKNDDHDNGISVADILKIQNHLLGVQEFDSPYDYLAADVNNNGGVSVADMLQLRQLLLGIHSEFPDNTSWRFVYADQVFANPASPWPFDESIEITSFNADLLVDQDFVAIKVGDLNGTVDPNGLWDTEDRSAGDVAGLSAKNQYLNAGDILTVDFVADEDMVLTGLQASFDGEAIEILEVVSQAMPIKESDQRRWSQDQKDHWRVITTLESPQTISPGDILWSLKIRAKADTRLSDALQISQDFEAIWVGESTIENPLVLNWKEDQRSDLSTEWTMAKNTPNPFAEYTTVEINVPKPASLSWACKDLQGKTIMQNSMQVEPGIQRLQINADQIPHGGVYLLEVWAADKNGKEIYRDAQKIIKLR